MSSWFRVCSATFRMLPKTLKGSRCRCCCRARALARSCAALPTLYAANSVWSGARFVRILFVLFGGGAGISTTESDDELSVLGDRAGGGAFFGAGVSRMGVRCPGAGVSVAPLACRGVPLGCDGRETYLRDALPVVFSGGLAVCVFVTLPGVCAGLGVSRARFFGSASLAESRGVLVPLLSALARAGPPALPSSVLCGARPVPVAGVLVSLCTCGLTIGRMTGRFAGAAWMRLMCGA